MDTLLASDSQVTLVNVAPAVELVFTKKSVTNSSVLKGTTLIRSVSTPDASGLRTYIRDAYGQELVSIHRRHFLDDTVTFAHHYNSEKLKIKNWILRGKLPTGKDCWTLETPIGTYIWRTDVQTRLCLCHESDLESPIAWQRPLTPGGKLPLALFYKAMAEPFVDIVLASFVVIEQEMRLVEKRSFGVAIQDGA